jgi:hypothetical protein
VGAPATTIGGEQEAKQKVAIWRKCKAVDGSDAASVSAIGRSNEGVYRPDWPWAGPNVSNKGPPERERIFTRSPQGQPTRRTAEGQPQSGV